jgi:hypothetical protein
MKSAALLVLMIVISTTATGLQSSPSAPPNDQLVLIEQYVQWFFPQLTGRDASIHFSASYALSSAGVRPEPRPGEVSFEVTDWCALPTGPDGRRIMLYPAVPCSQTDKTYKPPLKGTIRFTNRHGRVVPVEGRFNGEILEAPGRCRGTPTLKREDFIKRLHLDKLSIFLGGPVKMVKGGEQIEGVTWTIWIKVGPSSVQHSLYAFYFDECGDVSAFALRD